MQERVDVLVEKLESLKDTGKVVNLLHAFSAFSNGKIILVLEEFMANENTVDVISQYLFGTSEHRLEAANFDPSYHHNVIGAGAAVVTVKHFPIMAVIINSLPEFITDNIGMMADQKKIKKVSLHSLPFRSPGNIRR